MQSLGLYDITISSFLKGTACEGQLKMVCWIPFHMSNYQNKTEGYCTTLAFCRAAMFISGHSAECITLTKCVGTHSASFLLWAPRRLDVPFVALFLMFCDDTRLMTGWLPSKNYYCVSKTVIFCKAIQRWIIPRSYTTWTKKNKEEEKDT